VAFSQTDAAGAEQGQPAAAAPRPATLMTPRSALSSLNSLIALESRGKLCSVAVDRCPVEAAQPSPH